MCNIPFKKATAFSQPGVLCSGLIFVHTPAGNLIGLSRSDANEMYEV